MSTCWTRPQLRYAFGHPTSQMGKPRLRTYISSLSNPSATSLHSELSDGNERTQGGSLSQENISNPPSTMSRLASVSAICCCPTTKTSSVTGGKAISVVSARATTPTENSTLGPDPGHDLGHETGLRASRDLQYFHHRIQALYSRPSQKPPAGEVDLPSAPVAFCSRPCCWRVNVTL